MCGIKLILMPNTTPNPLQLKKLFWNPENMVFADDSINDYLKNNIAFPFNKYVPNDLTFYFDLEISTDFRQKFTASFAYHLEKAIMNWMRVRDKMVNLRLFSFEEIEDFLTNSNGMQPWIFYLSDKGGINLKNNYKFDIANPNGVIASPAASDAALGWFSDSLNSIRSFTITSRKENDKGFDWDFQVAHEAAHNAFAQISLFTEVYHYQNYDLKRFETLRNTSEMRINDFAKLVNAYTEIVVSAFCSKSLREGSTTETGLYVTETVGELQTFFRLSHQLMPNYGFDKAWAFAKTVDYKIESNSVEILQLAAPCMKALISTKVFLNSFEAPNLQWFKQFHSQYMSVN
jgi:hypothetical protein